MPQNHQRSWRWTILAAALTILTNSTTGAGAETRTVRIAKQYGISYLPLTIMEEKKLLEAEGKKRGLDLSTEWVKFTGGPPMNEALISGNLDFASGGVGPLVTIWARTQNNLKVKGVAALNSMPLYLNTIKPEIKIDQGFHRQRPHRAARRARVDPGRCFADGRGKNLWQGPGAQARRLDRVAQPSGRPGADDERQVGDHRPPHSAPFQYQELADKRVHKVLDSFEVLGGPHTFNIVYATTKLYDRKSEAH